ncbi:MAG TPA: 3-hydroxyacyl-CoA dehydrogenase/enoyl-CoA hydratase family protein [Bacillota bacterium]|jgi:3-hydroxyacyl-CoA dehydrogenase|nr:3-hydroxyacyl-CoA dehydrogenase [Bacillota bacterium]HOB86388.1 3-hydroxyacyl-CoA dehydrogenase/enoyl-CoA hydratase family protein [Bacillota bacterium]HOP69393.1 3-hydroxyacyl-CoA dehydrogenase/enoyl-CoA hydratase family protein [Bacillota bacterium]HPT33200.1 3-hydroxyacyl-CoA dehydrogenase/enoyl-CoA hydratase family protein [Bacillota bacterium]HQD05946.1 3-hydroxyacyl-CoA dehydrogenase/enoyl-CoA hydratase family protein [Bacillota bacterium]
MAVKEIRKVAVLGAGVMGATIAAHLANVGLPVYLLDIVPRQLTPEEEKAGLTLESPAVRNRLATAGKNGLLALKPSPLYQKSAIDLITPGNFEDDMDKLKECDWIVEVIVENIEIKKKVFKNVENHWTPGTIVSSNTSGLSINEMVSENSPEFRKYFLGTHFFNPPRYMKLLELIPCRETSPEVLKYMHRFCEKVLGKGVVFAKDTPNFIANRIGTYAMVYTINLMKQENMTIEEVDAITGPPMGHPKSASFRTLDMVGLDTFCHVAKTCADKSDDPEEKAAMEMPDFVNQMLEKKWLGDKTKQGFYKKVKSEGKSEILALDYNTMEYRPRQKARFDILSQTKEAGLKEGFKMLISSDDKAGKFAWNLTKRLLLYSASLIPAISDDIVNVDRAMRWGFNWKMGPFESWDAIGVRESVERMKQEGEKIPALVEEMLNNGIESFYKEENGSLLYYDIESKKYQPVPTSPEIISLAALKKQNKLVIGNDDASLIDLGDGVCCLEMHTMRQAINPVFTKFIFEAVDAAEKDFVGMVIANQANNFCVGANVALILMAAQGGEWEMLDSVVKEFQDAMMRIKYSRIPVVAAPHQMTLGGGMEICLHCDRIHAAAETYLGQVEVGVGLIPGGGGNKELLIRYIEGIPEGAKIDMLPLVQKAFEAIAMAKVATSAREAQELGFLRPTDKISVNQDYLIHDAKQTVLSMAQAGYEPPRPKPIPVLGEYGLAAFKAAVQNLRWGGFISDYDMRIANEIAYVLCGGNIRPNSLVTEQYLLDIEREAFLRLLKEPKTHERITAMLTTGKPLRN